MVRVCETVGHAHQRGVIHRDLKPGNVLVDETGQPRVLDFGLSRLTAVEQPVDTAGRVSVSGQLLGTLAYMGPEQISGQPAEVDIRSDVFSLGVILYELLTSHLPFDLSGSFIENLTTIAACVPRPMIRRGRLVNRDLETIVMKALSSEKSRRYQNGSAMAIDLQRFLAGKAIEARRDSTIYVLKKTIQKHWGASLTTLAIVIFMFVGLLIYRAQNERLKQLQATNEQYLYDMEMQLAGLAATGPGGSRQIDSIRSQWANEANTPVRRGWEWYYLNSQRVDSTSIRSGHDRQIWALATQPGGRLFASGGMDGIVRLWNREVDGHLTESFTQTLHLGGVTAVRFHPDRNLLASAGKDKVVQLLDVTTNQTVDQLKHPQVVNGLGWSPDGKHLATVCEDGVIRIWQPESDKVPQQLSSRDTPLKSVHWSPAGDRLAVASTNGRLEIWDVPQQRRLFDIQAHVATLVSIDWSQDGNLLATTSDDASTRIWNSETGNLIAVLADHSLGVTAAIWSPDGAHLATCSRDATICVYRIEDSRFVLETTLRGHTDEVLSLEWDEESRRLYSAGWDHAIRIWDLDTIGQRSKSHTMEESIVSIHWDYSGTQYLTIGEASTLLLWSLEANAAVPLTHHLTSISDVSWSPDNEMIAVSGVREGLGAVEIWNLGDKSLVTRLTISDAEIISLSWNRSAAYLATCSSSGNIHLWSTKTWEVQHKLSSSIADNTAEYIDWNSNGTRLALAGKLGIEIRELNSWSTLWKKKLDSQMGPSITGLKFSPDGRCVATVLSDATVRLWDSDSAQTLAEMFGHGLLIYNVCWHPDSSRLATSSRDGSARIWNAETGREVHRFLVKPVGRARGLDWSPDGYRLAISNTISHYGVIRIFDAESGYQQAEKAPSHGLTPSSETAKSR